MAIHPGSSTFLPGAPTCVTWGVFDGVHRGHRHVLDLLAREARIRGLVAVVLTFDPHPEWVLRGSRVPVLTSLDQKERRLHDAGAAHVVVEPFTKEFALTPAETFLREVVVSRLRARMVLLGFDSAFGHDREGSLATVRRIAPSLGVEVMSVPPFTLEGGPVSSSRIRDAIGAGKMEAAARLLGRPYELWGRVEHGSGRGSTMGIPTANIHVAGQMMPGRGVYGCEAAVRGGDLRGVVNVGRRPTFEPEGAPETVEIHLMGFAGGDLYGEPIEIRFVRRLRDEKKFDSAASLVRQIREDIRAWEHD